MRRPDAKLLVTITIVLVGAASIVLLLPLAPGNYNGQLPSKFTVNGVTYQFTGKATTESERETGLMNARITNSTFMLFAFPNPTQQSFYMYQVNSTLDMIWVNATTASGTVVSVVESAPPCYNIGGVGCATYAPSSPANFVIEAKGGFSAAAGIAVGTEITFS